MGWDRGRVDGLAVALDACEFCKFEGLSVLSSLWPLDPIFGLFLCFVDVVHYGYCMLHLVLYFSPICKQWTYVNLTYISNIHLHNMRDSI